MNVMFFRRMLLPDLVSAVAIALPRRRRIAWVIAGVLGLSAPGLARADAVIDWNATAGSVAPVFGAPQQRSRVMAIVQIAIHDALNSIDPRYESYVVVPASTATASPDAAVAAAARGTLLALLDTVPDSPLKTDAIATVNNAYDAALAAIPDGTAKSEGIAAGMDAADAILALRASDGSATPHLPYTDPPGPGVYQPTPNPEFPAVITPSFAGWAYVAPFALHSASQFRVEPGEIFDLASEAYTREYNEVKEVGDALVRGVAPDSEESDIARFWPAGGANWNVTTRGIVAGRGLDLWQHARLFALLNIAEADGHIANMDSKYTYKVWRPVTAIRWADDGNPDTTSDPGWRPFLVTPAYPDYPCGLPTASGANTEVLRRFFGTDDIAFVRTNNAGAVPLPPPLAALPPKTITRHFESLSEASSESADARVFAGIHFRSGCTAGVRLGTHVARFVSQHYLRPLK